MRALQVSRLAPDHAGCAIADLPVPEPGPSEVRVRVRAAAVNFPDLLMTRGAYQLKPDLPFVSGLEFSGEVDAVGEGVAGWQAGDAVVSGNRFGAMAEYACEKRGFSFATSSMRAAMTRAPKPASCASQTSRVEMIDAASLPPRRSAAAADLSSAER